MRYRINTPGVVHQTIDGETVIIHLDRGLYYSLDKMGADIWAAIQVSMSLPELIDLLERRYAHDGTDIDTAVAAFVANLRSEELLVEDTGGPDRAAEDLSLPGGAPRSEGVPFAPPVLHKYTDLQDLLLLDPIHQVDEAGWPDARPAPPPAKSL